MDNINQQLAALQAELNSIDLAQLLSLAQVQAKEAKHTQAVDSLLQNTDFNNYNLATLIKTYDETIQRLSNYRYNLNSTSTQDQIMTENEKYAFINQIKNKYSELNKKKEIIDKYSEKFDIDDLEKIQQNKLKGLDKAHEDSENRLATFESFKTICAPQFQTIKDCQKIFAQLNKLESSISEYESLSAKGVHNGILSQKRDEIVKKCQSLSQEHCFQLTTNGSDFTVLKSEITGLKNKNQTEFADAAAFIRNKADSSKEYSDIKNMLTSIKPEDFEKTISGEIASISADLFTIDETINQINTNLHEIEDIKAPVKTSIDDTDIEAEVNSAPDAYALPALTKKDMSKAIYEQLTQGKKGKFHPILWLKSHSKSAREDYIEQLENDRKNKIEQAINKKRKNLQATKDNKRRSTQNLFAQKLSNYVISQTDETEINKMHKNATSKKGSKVDIANVYNNMIDDDFNR